LLLIGLQALTSRAFANWAAPWIVSASVFTAAYMASSDRLSRWLTRGLALQLIVVSVFYHWPQILDATHTERTIKNDPFHRMDGWRQLADEIKPAMPTHYDAIASDSRELLAYLGYYLEPDGVKFARWNPDSDNIRDQYDLKYNFRTQLNLHQRYVFFREQPLTPDILDHFSASRYLGEYEVNVYPQLTRRVYMYELDNFLGYE